MSKVDSIEVLPSIESDIKRLDDARHELLGLLPDNAPSDPRIEKALGAIGDGRSGLLYLSAKLNWAAEKLDMEPVDMPGEAEL